MFVNFSEETRHLLKQAEKEKEALNHPYVGSEHLLLSVLKDSRLTETLKKYKITYKKFRDRLINLVGIGSKKSDFILYTPLLKRVLENAVIEAREENNKIVNPEIVIISILDEEDGIAYSILRSFNVNVDRLYYDLKNKRTNKFSKKKKLLLEDIGTNLTKLAKENRMDPVIGRDEEINKTIEILLRRKKNNPILIGPAGVGKTAIVEGLANLMTSSDCPKFLQNKKIISLNIFALVSGTKYRGEFEEKMKTIIKELEDNDDIILFIDEVHTMVGAGGAEGAIDASNIFKPALARGMIRIVGATTLDEYKKFIEPDAALARRFQIVNVEEPKQEDVIKILTEIKPLYEKYHNIKIPKDLIKEIVLLSSKYLTNRFEPDRSIDILDEVCAKSSVLESYDDKRKKTLNNRLLMVRKEKINALSTQNFKRAYGLKTEENKILKDIDNIKPNKKYVTKSDILDVIKRKGNIKSFGSDIKKNYYEDLEKYLNDKVIGQEDNIKKLVKSLKKKNIINKKQSYVVLITGESGSGKSFLAQTYLEKISNSKDIIKIDLSEYKEYHTISKLIGTTAGYLGYDNKNNIFEKIRTNPSSAIIVDNFTEGCDEVQSLFFKIMENNYVEDASGKKIDFSNTTIIFTCNDTVSSSVGFNNNLTCNSHSLPDKLMNRASVKIKMKKLTDDDKLKIIEKQIKKVINDYEKISINVPDKYTENMFKLHKEKKDLMGAINIILEDLENQIIEGVINGEENIKIKLNDNVAL